MNHAVVAFYSEMLPIYIFFSTVFCSMIIFFSFSLHEEVMAQRALDRRLTEELMRFKGTIGILTR